jgi:hypothetical protein
MSEIRVDTISEKTSANGVAVDGVTLKDGAITSTAASTITVADNSDNLTLVSTDADANSGPNLILQRDSGSPADGDAIGRIDFDADNDAGEVTSFFSIRAEIEDASDGTEDGQMKIDQMIAGTAVTALRFKSSETVFNDDSKDVDFRVESDANANRFKLDAGDDVIVMGTGTVEDSIYGAKPALQLTGTDFNSSAFSIIRNAADANSPNLIFGKSRSADGNTVVQDGDDLGNITFAAADGTDQNNTAARIYAEVDGAPGANDTPGRLVFATTADGANSATERLRIDSSGVATFASTVIATGLLNTVNNSLLMIGGGNATNVGSNLTMYGGADGSAGVFRFRNATTVTANVTASGQIQGYSLGSSSPTFSFTTDTNTGMTRPTTDTLTLVTGGAEAMRVTSGQTISTGGEASPDVGAGGLGLDQNANDDAIITLKSSDVAHGVTNVMETDTYLKVSKNSAGSGGAAFIGGMETVNTFLFRGYHTNENSTQSTSGSDATFRFDSSLKSGTGGTGNNASANIFRIDDDNTARVLITGDGDIFSDTGAGPTAYDAYEDAQLVRAYDLAVSSNIINSKFDKFISYNKEKLADLRIIGKNTDGSPSTMVNINGMQRLHNGAIWQQYEKHQKLASAFYKLAEKTIGKEEADKLLTEEEIQLLN